jgi:hypothetical protein
LQASYAANFSREMGCTETEWLGWLPAAIGEHAWYRDGGTAHISITHDGQALGTVVIHWSVGPLRRIALVALPCLHVHFQFEGLDEAQRYTFMRRFDLYMQRGGG